MSGEMHWMYLSVTLTQAHGCGIGKQKFASLPNKVRITHPSTTKLGSYTLLVMLYTWLDFGEILQETYFVNFL